MRVARLLAAPGESLWGGGDSDCFEHRSTERQGEHRVQITQGVGCEPMTDRDRSSVWFARERRRFTIVAFGPPHVHHEARTHTRCTSLHEMYPGAKRRIYM